MFHSCDGVCFIGVCFIGVMVCVLLMDGACFIHVIVCGLLVCVLFMLLCVLKMVCVLLM